MSDLETIKAMLTRAGVVFIEDPAPLTAHEWSHEVRIEEGDGPRNWGWPHFASIFYFGDDGSLVAMGAWE